MMTEAEHDGGAVMIPPGARLAYPAQGGYDPKCGTVAMGVRPN